MSVRRNRGYGSYKEGGSPVRACDFDAVQDAGIGGNDSTYGRHLTQENMQHKQRDIV